MVAIVSEYTQLRRVGRRWSGLCPFHAERSPSFSVNGEEGLYYCFGCGVGGDVIGFVQEKELLDFVGAVEWLAHKANITIRYTDSGQSEDRKRKARLHDILAKAVAWYHDRLLTGADAGAARSYLRQRGLDGDTVRRYQIGWAPDDFDQLVRSLRLTDAELNGTGLGFINRRGRQQDFFRARVLFPIFDPTGQAVGFGGRILPGGEGPKYKNTAESAVYAKSRVLYGLNWAKGDIVAADEVIVCEGYTDVIGFARAGIGRAVATCGTALTEDHVRLLRRFARRVVLAFDADAAGQNAAARFYEWEKAHDLDVAVADLPAGVDPGELALTDPERLAAAITGAHSFLEFRVSRAIGAVDRSTGEGRARAAERALDMVVEHPDALVRDQYVMEIASRCRFEPDVIRDQLRQKLARGGPGGAGGSSGGGGREQADRGGRNQRTDGGGGGRYADGPDGPDGYDAGGRGGRDGRGRGSEPRGVSRRADRPSDRELEALRVYVHRRGEIAHLLVPELFVNPLCAAVFDLMGKFPSLHEAIDQADLEVGELLQRLAVEDSDVDPMDVSGLLWEGYLERQIERCRLDARDNPNLYAQLAEDLGWFRLELEQVRDPERRAAAVEALLGWVVEDSEEDS